MIRVWTERERRTFESEKPQGAEWANGEENKVSPQNLHNRRQMRQRGAVGILEAKKTLCRIISLSVLNTFEIFNKTVLLSIADDTRVYINLFL